MKRRTAKSGWYYAGRCSACLVMILCAVSTIYPIVWLGITSIKRNSEVYVNPWALPAAPQFENFLIAWTDGNMSVFFRNSVFLGVVCTGLSLLISCMSAYGITRFDLKPAKWIEIYFLFGILVPIHSVLIPLFMIMMKCRLLNTMVALVVIYITFMLPTSIFLLSAGMRSIPNELEEAAVIDGCMTVKMFFHVIVPLSTPTLFTVATLNFLLVCNEYIFALIFTGNKRLRTLPVGLASFAGVYGSDYATMAAGVIIAIIPSIAVFTILQDKVIKGVTAGAIK